MYIFVIFMVFLQNCAKKENTKSVDEVYFEEETQETVVSDIQETRYVNAPEEFRVIKGDVCIVGEDGENSTVTDAVYWINGSRINPMARI